jgi:hypothetical protein
VNSFEENRMGRVASAISVFSLNRINPVPLRNLNALFGILTITLVVVVSTEELSSIGIPFLLAKLNG